ncbi:MAG: 50S ribosomal protein L29 [archaeon]|nr:50S ribosomal protein L29 [archaeon]
MAILKAKDVAKMQVKEINEKIEELRIELIKSRASGKKSGKSNVHEIKRTIARLLTFKKINEINKTEAKQSKKE